MGMLGLVIMWYRTRGGMLKNFSHEFRVDKRTIVQMDEVRTRKFTVDSY